MRKTAIALITALLVATAAGTLLVRLGNANPIAPPAYPETPDANQTSIAVQSPALTGSYNTNTVPYSFTVQKPHSWFDYLPVHGDLVSVSYILDGNKVDVAGSGLDQGHYDSKPLSFNGTLTGLTEGNHSLRVYVRSVSYYLDPNRPTSGYGWWLYPPANYYMDAYSATVPFLVDTISPSINILSIENKTYTSGDVPLKFAVDEPTAEISYCLDNSANVTISGNTTLTGVSTGGHTMVVYATDYAGNTAASEATQFTVTQETEPEPSPLPVMTVAAGVAVVAAVVVAAGLLLIRKRRKEAQQE